MTSPIRYQWRDNATKKIVKFDDGSSIQLAKSGCMCYIPPEGMNRKVKYLAAVEG